MSADSAKKFLEKVKADETFASLMRQAKTPEARTKIAKDAGFDFTASELDEARKGELSEKELAGVAGGGFLDCWTNVCVH